MSTTKYKILKPFYCYHPDIIFDDRLRPAFWGVEWTVATKNNPQPTIYTHYMRQVDTETEAQRLTLELASFGGEYAWWQELDDECWYLNPKYKMNVMSPKKFVILPDHHSE